MNSNGQKHPVNASSEIKPYQDCGVYIHNDIALLVRAGAMSWTEAVLLSRIDGLVRVLDEGCWATNQHLAEFLHKSESQITKMIHKFKKMGLVAEKGYISDGRGRLRLLETKWSKILHKKSKHLSKNAETHISKNAETHISKNAEHSNRDGKIEKEHTVARPKSRSANAHSRRDDGVSVKTLSGDKEDFKNAPEHKLASKLFKALGRRQLLIPNSRFTTDRWVKPFRVLLKERSFERVEATLNWYIKNLDNIVELSLPQALSADSFVEKYAKIILQRDRINLKKKQEREKKEREGW